MSLKSQQYLMDLKLQKDISSTKSLMSTGCSKPPLRPFLSLPQAQQSSYSKQSDLKSTRKLNRVNSGYIQSHWTTMHTGLKSPINGLSIHQSKSPHRLHSASMPALNLSEFQGNQTPYAPKFQKKILAQFYNTDAFFDEDGRLQAKKIRQPVQTQPFFEMPEQKPVFQQTTKNFNTHHITIHNVIQAAVSKKGRPNLKNAKSVQQILKQ